MENWLDCQAQRAVISCGKFISWSVASDILPGLVLGLILFKVCINDLYDGTECILHKVVYGTKLAEMINTLEGRAAFQKDLVGLEKCVYRNLMKFNTNKYEVLCQRRSSLMQQ